MIALKVILPLRTNNAQNGATGNSRVSAIIRTKKRAAHRNTTRLAIGAHIRALGVEPVAYLPARITITRISAGRLDPWDGLGPALKAVIDGVADVFGLRDDDRRFTWKLEQRKGPPKHYAVEVLIERGAP